MAKLKNYGWVGFGRGNQSFRYICRAPSRAAVARLLGYAINANATCFTQTGNTEEIRALDGHPELTILRAPGLAFVAEEYEVVPAAGSHTEPIRTQFIDYDSRREPKTDRYCVACQKDLKPLVMVRKVYLNEHMSAVHPDDLARYTKQPGDYGWHLLGLDCARVLGLEWSVPETP